MSISLLLLHLQLGFDGIKINSLFVEYQEAKDGIARNEFKTFIDEADFNLQYGLDFRPAGSIFARVNHLQHAKYRFSFDIQNNGVDIKAGTIRIFLAHKLDYQGQELTLDELRNLMIELDRFEVICKYGYNNDDSSLKRFSFSVNPGSNQIKRNSEQSSVIVPDQNIFQPDVVRPAVISKKPGIDYCLSGWPSYLLIPKGNRQGAPFTLFAMVSNGIDDKILPIETPDIIDKCSRATSYCGLKNRKYPDKRSMGFPWDRPTSPEILTMAEFLLPNMIAQDVKIRFVDFQ